MISLASLKKSISNLSEQEAIELVRERRVSRLVSKKKVKEIDVAALVQPLSKEEAMEVLVELGVMKRKKARCCYCGREL